MHTTNSPRPNRPPSAASSQGSETPITTLKKTSAKTQQKLMVLYHPEDPNRRKFVDEVIRFHEEKGQPLKGPPMFAQSPLDLYLLYHHVKQRNGMNEVIIYSKNIITRSLKNIPLKSHPVHLISGY